jgi:hypothetical protein
MIRPSRIALYLKDKLVLSFFYFLFFSILVVMPNVIRYNVNDNSLTNSQIEELLQKRPESSNAYFKDAAFSTDSKFSLSYDDVKYNFGNGQELSNNLTIEFNDVNMTFYKNKTAVMTVKYSSLNISNFNFDKIDTKNYNTDFFSFKNMINDIYYNYFRESNLKSSIILILDNIFTSFVVLALIFIICGFLNPYLKAIHKFNLSVYSSTWYFVIKFVHNYFELRFLVYIGVLVALFCLVRALSSIKVVKVPKER